MPRPFNVVGLLQVSEKKTQIIPVVDLHNERMVGA